MKTKNILLTICLFLISTNILANTSIYINALNSMGHLIHHNKLSLKGSIEHSINDKFDIGSSIGFSKGSEYDYLSFGLYLDRLLFANKNNGLQKEAWFIRNYFGITCSDVYEKNKFLNSVNKGDVHNNQSKINNGYGSRSEGGGGHGRSFVYTDYGNANTVIRGVTLSTSSGSEYISKNQEGKIRSYEPEYGLYIGKKYNFNNKTSVQFGAGVVIPFRESNGFSFKILKDNNLYFDSFLNIGFNI